MVHRKICLQMFITDIYQKVPKLYSIHSIQMNLKKIIPNEKTYTKDNVMYNSFYIKFRKDKSIVIEIRSLLGIKGMKLNANSSQRIISGDEDILYYHYSGSLVHICQSSSNLTLKTY